MRRASLLVACFAMLCSPAFAQARPGDGNPSQTVRDVVDRDGEAKRDPVVKRVVVATPATPKTRSLVARSSGRADFTIPWQTGIYQ